MSATAELSVLCLRGPDAAHGGQDTTQVPSKPSQEDVPCIWLPRLQSVQCGKKKGGWAKQGETGARSESMMPNDELTFTPKLNTTRGGIVDEQRNAWVRIAATEHPRIKVGHSVSDMSIGWRCGSRALRVKQGAATF